MDKEFWEKCGFEWVDRNDDIIGDPDFGTKHWRYPDGDIQFSLPPIDLEHIGLLFKYAVPKLKGRTRIHFSFNPLRVSVLEEVGSGESPLYYEHRCVNQEDPAIALKLAIEEVWNG